MQNEETIINPAIVEDMPDFGEETAKEEGLYLDHCVFRAGYYQRENSLILSARDENNNPIETIEVNLRNFTISQCYGYSDEFSSLHKEILATMNENIWRVKEIAQKQKSVA